jgi:hypothetical protein
MSNQIVLHIPQISDRGVIDGFTSVFGKHSSARFIASLLGQMTIESPLYGADESLTPAWANILELKSSLFITLTAQYSSIGFTYCRGGQQHNSAIYDAIVVNINQNIATPAPEERLRLLAAVKKAFKAFDPKRSINADTNAAQNQLAALHESTLNRLEETAARIIEQTAERQNELESAYLVKRNELEEQLQQERGKLQQEFTEKLGEIQRREEELALRQASIDDRNNTHARRETRNKLLEDVRNQIANFGVTAATAKKRTPVLLGFTIIFIALFYLGLATWQEIGDYHTRVDTLFAATTTSNMPEKAVPPKELQSLSLTKADLYILWLRLSLVAISIAGIAMYFIKWQNRWAEQHTIAEFQLQQFYLDVNRANWVVESGLEWHKETGTSIPNGLLEQLTHNLFKAAAEPPPALHPADELASALLGSASKLKLKTGDSELEFNKPNKIPERT